MMFQPIILIVADYAYIENRPSYTVRHQYIKAAYDIANVTPLIIPCLPSININGLLNNIDGILLTGAASNIHPSYYQSDCNNVEQYQPFDKNRDAIAIALIKQAIAKDMPILAICRGMQELNIALGGTLEKNIQNIAGKIDHRSIESDSYDKQYEIRQSIIIKENSLLYKIVRNKEIKVNSLHSQAIRELAPNLSINAMAYDSTIEAVSLDSNNFVLGVQFHPEYWVENDPISKDIFLAFGDAVLNYKKLKDKNE